jgi:hypothetical protein
MNRIHRGDLKLLVDQQVSPCVSLFMPCTVAGRDSRGDAVRLREMCDEAAARLQERELNRNQAEEVVAPLRRLADDEQAWQHRGQGLAAFAAPGFAQHFFLHQAVDPALHVDGLFHIRPLLALLADDDRFFVLALSQKHVRLLVGDADELRAMELAELQPRLDRRLNATIQGQRPDQHQLDPRLLFEVVAETIDDRLKDERAPLVLATTEASVPLMRSLLQYKFLIDEFIPGDPQHLSASALHEKAWPLVQPALDGHRRWCEQRLLESDGSKVEFGLETIVPAAISGRVSALFIKCDQTRWGRYDTANHRTILHAECEPGDDDLVELAASETLRQGGDVFPLRPGDRIKAEEAEALMRF